MIDLEFVNAPSEFKGVLLYRYSSGVLRRHVKRALADVAEKMGLSLSSCDPSALEESWVLPGLFPVMLVCDVSADHPGFASQALLQRIKRLAAITPVQPVALFVRTTVADATEFPAQDVTFVEEPGVTGRNVQALLKYAESQSDLKTGGDIASQPSFQQYFREWIRERGEASLADLIQEFEKSVLLYSDQLTGEFVAPETDSRPESLSLVVRSLRQFLVEDSARHVTNLLRAIFAKKSRGMSSYKLVDELCRASQIILSRPLVTAEAATIGLSTKELRLRAALWSAMLLVWSQEIVASDRSLSRFDEGRILVQLDQLCRKFSKRRALAESDPLEGYWGPLNDAVGHLQNSNSGSRNYRWDPLCELRLIEVTSPPPWLDKLRRLLLSDRVNDAKPIAVTAPECASFSELIGHAGVIRELERRFSKEEHRMPLVLCGPEGVGKIAVARVYARALLCEHRTYGHMAPCGTCQSCSTFETNKGFGYAEIDASHPESLKHARTFVENGRTFPLSKHRIVVIKNPEHQTSAIDAFLKSFEEGAVRTTFIVLTHDIRAVRAAAISRAAVCALRPLTAEQCVMLLGRWGRGILNADVIKLISVLGRHLPGPMWNAFRQVGGSARELADAKAVLGLGWAVERLRYWRSLLGESEPASDDLTLEASVDVKEVVRRNLMLLSQLDSSRTYEVAAFLGLEECLLDLSNMVGLRAAQQGVSKDVLLRTLRRQWMTDAVVDADSFFETSIFSRDIIVGRRGALAA